MKKAEFFPLLHNNKLTSKAIEEFQSHIYLGITEKQNIYNCYNIFILFEDCIFITRINEKLESAIRAAIIVKNNLVYYRPTDNNFYSFQIFL